MNSEEKHEWDRLRGESSKAYHHFCLYRDMGVARSLRQMANVSGCTSQRRQLNRWSTRWRWVERCGQYDDYLERQARLQQEKERREMYKRHAKIAMLGQNILVKGMEELLAKVQNGEHNLAPSELARLMDVSVKVERLARGESTDIHEAVGPGGEQNQVNILNLSIDDETALKMAQTYAQRHRHRRTDEPTGE